MMQFTCDSKTLRSALETIKPAVAVDGSIDLYQTVQIVAAGDSVVLMGTDTEVAMQTVVEAVVEQDGCVNAKLTDLLKLLPRSGEAWFWLTGDALELRCNDALYILEHQTSEDYPVMPEMPVKLKAKLQKAMFKCMPFVSHEETRHYLNGVYLTGDENGLECAATDWRILKAVRLDNRKRKPFGIIVPAKAALILATRFADGMMEIGYDDDVAVFNSGDLTLSSTLIDGVYPNYRGAIDAIGSDVVITMNKQELEDRIAAVSKVLPKRCGHIWGGVKFICVRGGGVTLSATDGKTTASSEIESVVNTDDIFALNPSYLMECLSTVDADGGMVTFTKDRDSLGAISISGTGAEHTGIMSYKLKDL